MLETIILPSDAKKQIRARLGISNGRDLRISYLCGPGDVAGTFKYWQEGRHDPRVPVITYSGMFYDLVKELGACAQIVTQSDVGDIPGGPFEFVHVMRRRSTGYIDYLRAEAEYANACLGAVNRFAPHVVIAATDAPSSAWRALARKRKLVLSSHNTFWPMGLKSKGMKSTLKRILLSTRAQAIDAAVCISAECMRQLSEITGSRVRGTVAIPQIATVHPAISYNALARRFLFLGRIEANKGVFLLLESFLQLGDVGKALTLQFAGAGNADEELRSRIAASGVPNISHLGKLNSEGVHAAIARSDVLICPTTSEFSEGLAVVPFEAAAHGIPSVISSVVPASDALGSGCLIFEADSVKALVQALVTVSTDTTRYRAMVEGASKLKPLLYDRSRSWGSQLGAALLSL